MDKADGRYWELDCPSSGEHGGSAPCLQVLAHDEAVKKFKKNGRVEADANAKRIGYLVEFELVELGGFGCLAPSAFLPDSKVGCIVNGYPTNIPRNP